MQNVNTSTPSLTAIAYVKGVINLGTISPTDLAENKNFRLKLVSFAGITVYKLTLSINDGPTTF